MEQLQQVAALDWLLLALLLMSMLIGAWRGLVYEVLAVLGWIAAFVMAQAVGGMVGQLLPLGSASESLRYAAGFASVFVATALLAGLLSWLASRAIQNIGLRPVDRILGAGFGALRGLLILLALVTLVQLSPLKDGPWWQKSQGYLLLETGLKKLKPVLPSELGKYITVQHHFGWPSDRFTGI